MKETYNCKEPTNRSHPIGPIQQGTQVSSVNYEQCIVSELVDDDGTNYELQSCAYVEPI